MVYMLWSIETLLYYLVHGLCCVYQVVQIWHEWIILFLRFSQQYHCVIPTWYWSYCESSEISELRSRNDSCLQIPCHLVQHCWYNNFKNEGMHFARHIAMKTSISDTTMTEHKMWNYSTDSLIYLTHIQERSALIQLPSPKNSTVYQICSLKTNNPPSAKPLFT